MNSHSIVSATAGLMIFHGVTLFILTLLSQFLSEDVKGLCCFIVERVPLDS